MRTRMRPKGILWWLLLVLPAAIIALLVAGGFGARQEGVLPELLSQDPTGDGFPAFARVARPWSAVVLGLASATGIALWYSLRRGWRRALRDFDPGKVRSYRRRVWGWRVPIALVLGAVVGSILLLVAPPPLDGISRAGWLVILALCALLALLQYVMTVFGVGETRHLHAGKG